MGNKNPPKVEEKPIKMLLLGSGESGKSTFFKQIKLKYDSQGFTEEEILHYKSNIYANIIQTIKVLSIACNKKGYEYDAGNKEKAQDIIDLGEDESALLLNATTKYTKDVHSKIKDLWKDSAVQKSFLTKEEFHIFDGCHYYFGKLDQLAPPSYTPSNEDLLYCRKKTIGITEINFELEKKPFILCDVGGQRNERKKWEKSFEGVSVVLFVFSLNDYDLLCYEDDKTNRLEESLTLFDQICNGDWFNKSLIMLIMNKQDLFKKKLKDKPLKDYYSAYEGGDDFDKGVEFIENLFRARNKFEKDRIFSFKAQATNSENIQDILAKVTKQVIEYNKTKGIN